MVWTIPLAEVAGMLAVSFTSGAPTVPPPHSGPPVQRPGSAGTEPPVIPTAPDPSDPLGPTPPQLPPDGEPAETPPPTTPPSTLAPVPPTPPAETERAPIEDDEKEGKRERLLRPTDRRRFFAMTAGGATPGGMAAYYGGGGMDFQSELLIGSHSRKNPTFGGGFVVQFRKGFTTELSFAGRLMWDKPISKSFAIYSAVDLTLGLNVPIGYAGYLAPGIPSALIGIGWGVKAILAERFLLLFRPIGPNLCAPEFYSQLFVRFRWDVGGGIGIVW